MQKGLKAGLVFASMVATPLVLRAFATPHPLPITADYARTVEVGYGPWLFLLPAWLILAVCIFVYDRLDRIATCLKLAERDFNVLISGMMEHGGRKARAAERSEWNKMTQVPAIQIFQEGYKTVAHELIEANEKDLQGKSVVGGRASITAFLLRELYEGNVESAQMKVWADTRNGDRKPPYIAPGIRELIGFDSFDPDKGFAEGAGVNSLALWLTVKLWGFPKNILMVRTNANGERFAVRGRALLTEMTQQQL